MKDYAYEPLKSPQASSAWTGFVYAVAFIAILVGACALMDVL